MEVKKETYQIRTQSNELVAEFNNLKDAVRLISKNERRNLKLLKVEIKETEYSKDNIKILKNAFNIKKEVK